MNTYHPRALASASFLFLLLLLSGCQTFNVVSVNHLRDAQGSFNQAAALENRNKLGAMGVEGATAGSVNAAQALVDLSASVVGYANALNSLAKLEADKEQVDQLKADKLWGTALTLKSLAQWKTGQASAAIVTADTALTQSREQLFPRDHATLAAIKGLIQIDVAYQKTIDLEPGDEGKTIFKIEIEPRLVGNGDTSAVNILQNARDLVGKDHPVNSYLIQSQLAAYINYKKAYQTVYENIVPESDPARLAAKQHLAELKELFKQLKITGTDLLKDYSLLAGLPNN